MNGMSFFIDLSRCIGCRACQVACKSWNQNAAEPSRNVGTYQNPQDLNGRTFKVVRFNEYYDRDRRPLWYYFPDQCRHCLDPPCKDTIESLAPGAVVHDKATGAVVYTEKTKKIPFEDVRLSCPYDVPRQAGDGTIVKCTMCIDRVSNGLQPACVKVCPTRAMNFGGRDEMVYMAEERAAALKTSFPRTQLLDQFEVRAIYLVTDTPERYHFLAVAGLNRGIDRKMALRRMFRPASRIAKRVAGA